MKKGQIMEGAVERVDFPNKGIVRTEEGTVTVKNVLPGQMIRFAISKKRSGRAEGRLLEVLQPSMLEKQEPACSLFPACGGCTWQSLSYESQLKLKAEQVKRLLAPVLRTETEFMKEPAAAAELVTGSAALSESNSAIDAVFEGILRSPQEFAYRNKMEFSFGNEYKDGPLTLGLHRRGSHYDVLTADDCHLVHSDMTALLKETLSFFQERQIPHYHKMTHEGILRHLLLRRAEKTGEILVCLVTAGIKEENTRKEFAEIQQEYTAHILALEQNLQGHIAGILHMRNDSLADIVQSDEATILYGQDYFYETLLGLRFKITPFSFFQTNSLGAEVLYGAAREYVAGFEAEKDGSAPVSPDLQNLRDMRTQNMWTQHMRNTHSTPKVIFDLYSGTGTIAQILAPVAEKVIGVEIVEEAVEAARENARMNGLDNCTFIAGDVLKVLNMISERPDFIVLDPPRDGIHPKALQKIIAYGAPRILYISCKPTSLARDLEVLLKNGYQAERICCVDMFPQTANVETVCLLGNHRLPKPDATVKIGIDMEDYYRIRDNAENKEKPE
ncbi:MAG: class I SAM-dependent RNA methyltransferase [Lachnospiraceae bacterium]|nr:class I SAM-dependent RNA methyltransferase [Lachnospiraceae bacterium]